MNPHAFFGVALVLVSLLFAACGGSSSETPYPLEPRPKRMGLGGSAS